MGLFGGLIGGLFGGGDKQSVTQKSTNKTTVNLETQIANVIDTSPLAPILEGLNSTVKKTSERSQELFQGLKESQTTSLRAQLAATVADIKTRQERTEVIDENFDRLFQFLKIAGLAVGGVFIWRFIT